MTINVYLVERKKKLKCGRTVVYYALKWRKADGTGWNQEQIGKASKTGGEFTRAMAKDRLREKEAEINTGAIPIDRPDRITLKDFRTLYRERRAAGEMQAEQARRRGKKYRKLGPATIREHDMTLRYLIERFGEKKVLRNISERTAERWVDALESGKLSDARKKGKDGGPLRHYGLGEQTIRGHIRNVKAIFNWARAFGYVNTNPFEDFIGTPLPSSSNHEVTFKDFEKLVKYADTPGWAAMFGLCRLAGLRRGEAQTLVWDGKATDREGTERRVGVDWEDRRIRLVSVKTRMYREVPICERLYEILLDTFEKAEDGAVTVTGLSPHNLTRLALKMAEAAKVRPWPKFFQAMRSSCENDWKVKKVAEPTYAAWLGHSVEVSRQHYVSPTDEEFAVVTGLSL